MPLPKTGLTYSGANVIFLLVFSWDETIKRICFSTTTINQILPDLVDWSFLDVYKKFIKVTSFENSEKRQGGKEKWDVLEGAGVG